MTYFLVVTALLSALALVGSRIADRQKVGRMKWGLVHVPRILLVLLIVAFVFQGIPNIAGVIGENVTRSMLRHHADRDSLRRWFALTDADWALGLAWKPEAGFAPPAPCYAHCDDTLQVTFMTLEGLCLVGGDRVTIHFDKTRRPKTWRVEGISDGC